MNIRALTVIIVCLFSVAAVGERATVGAYPCGRPRPYSGRIVLNLNHDWLFHAGDCDGTAIVCDESDWQQVDLPHDFQISQPWVPPAEDERPDLSDAASNVKSRLSARGFKEMSIGWYRRHITPDNQWQGRRVLIDFEGIMLVGDVFLNGERIGGTDYGYVGFEIDITDRLRYGEDNILAVRADTQKPENSRWYTGGGLFRDVNIIITDDSLHFTRHPLYITTPNVSEEKADVFIQAEATCLLSVNDLSFRLSIIAPDGGTVYQDVKTIPFSHRQRTNEYLIDSITIENPLLWDCDNPYLYTARIELLRPDGTAADCVSERFGIRSIEYSPEFGFKLNGRKVLLKGIANHHTLGALGAAAYPRAIEKRIQLLKDFGFNHIRTSHNPYSQSFLDLCDEYGILVVDELYDKWLTRFAGGRKEWTDLWQRDIPEFIRRDRNHPSVIMWSLGNELQTYWSLPYADWGVTPYRMQRTLLRRYDDTRPVTVAMHPRGRAIETDSLPAPLALETDIAAYNYRYKYFPGDARRFPNMIFYQSEASAEAMGPNYFDMNLDKVVGLAYWGMIDYLGESPGWPAKGWRNGIFDISLNPKPTAYFLRSIFKEDEPIVHIAIAGGGDSTDWNGVSVGTTEMVDHWNLNTDSLLTIYTYTNADEVELIINDISLGRRVNDRSDSRVRNRIRWEGISYEPGYIEAVAYSSDTIVARHRIETAGAPVMLRLEPDNTRWTADGMDLQHVSITAVDTEGRTMPDADTELSFAVSGPASIVGVINGDTNSDELTVGNEHRLFNGKATVILRSERSSGMVTLTVTGGDYKPTSLSLPLRSPTDWPIESPQTQPGTRWWWMGSAVDTANITALMNDYAAKGIGTLEITPIYGVQGNEQNELSYLSPEWMNVLKHVMKEGERLGMQIDMNGGTGWPFGGKTVGIDDAASRLLLQEYYLSGGKHCCMPITVNDDKQKGIARLEKVMAFAEHDTIDITEYVGIDDTLRWDIPKGEWHIIAMFCGKTLQKVKRAAPGGEGLVLNHFDQGAVGRYLNTFAEAFNSTATDYLAYFFNDSYEVYHADYTPGFTEEFARRRGYRLEHHLPLLTDTTDSDAKRRLATDYRLTMAELLEENFTQQWTSWAHAHGSRTRSQAHGSPANLIDLYAAVDIPECESFGISDFGITGLRTDSLTRPNFSDLSMLKYASSAAHITGKPLISSETLTWITDHFRTSLSQCKPEVDLMFAAGVNRIFFHGTAYSPANEPWPGWKFYASADISPTNSLWRDADAFFKYISRCQSFLQAGEPDNDFLLYIPIYDMWYDHPWTDKTRLTLFDINKMAERAPRFIAAVNSIYAAGYDVDYISDKYTRLLQYTDKRLVTSGGTTYKAIIIPGVRLMPLDVLQHLLHLARSGAKVVFAGGYPTDMPGFNGASKDTVGAYPCGRPSSKDSKAFRRCINELKSMEGGSVIVGAYPSGRPSSNDYTAALAATGVKAEPLRSELGLKAIRRKNNEGNHYFISNLKGEDTEGWVSLAVDARSAMLFNPMTDHSGKARLRKDGDDTQVYIQLASGESVILKTFVNEDVDVEPWIYLSGSCDTISLNGEWDIRFIDAQPEVRHVPKKTTLGSWTDIKGATGADITMGTAKYTYRFSLSSPHLHRYMLALGDVRESARVTVNGEYVATLFAVPFRCDISKHLKAGENTIEVEVTNLPANRIADMDRRGINWRRFKDINIVDINYKKSDYSTWHPVPSGLLGPVKILKQ